MLFVILLILITNTSHALKAEGIFKQGGLLAISYDAQNTRGIIINGKKLSLDKDGLIYYPINRNAQKLFVRQLLNTGTISKKVYKIEAQDYEVQNVKGVKKKHITPPKVNYKQIRKESAKIKQSRKINSAKMFNTLLPEFTWPLKGRLTGVYGSRRLYNGVEKSWHKGLDIAEKEKTPIYAPLKGRVILAIRNSFYNGNLVIIDHGKKIYTIYAHMYDIIAKRGDIVKPKDVIGLVGSTGRSTGPHLHWGVYIGQQAIDPAMLLKQDMKTAKKI
ncbi:MAG: M23 family metallopeptidase [Proteobacteria bacterium]|nr:M23 family metallopeptidase [Pseudomonadota bacterium]